MILPTWWQHDILHVVSLLEQRSNLFICESGNAATDAGHEERQVLVLLGELDELVHIWTDGFYATLHRWDGIALALQTHTLTHNSPKLAVGDIGRTAVMLPYSLRYHFSASSTT